MFDDFKKFGDKTVYIVPNLEHFHTTIYSNISPDFKLPSKQDH